MKCPICNERDCCMIVKVNGPSTTMCGACHVDLHRALKRGRMTAIEWAARRAMLYGFRRGLSHGRRSAKTPTTTSRDGARRDGGGT